jgi:hypothetical protein
MPTKKSPHHRQIRRSSRRPGDGRHGRALSKNVFDINEKVNVMIGFGRNSWFRRTVVYPPPGG